MKTKLSANGPLLSKIATGVWKWGEWGSNFSTTEIEKLIQASLEAGISTFDHADIYGNYGCEALFGEVLKANPSLRNEMEIVTKCGIKLISENRPSHKIKSYDTSKEHILFSVENSLKNLATDHIDLLLIHRPSPLMHPDEMAEAFTELKDSGKVLHFGVSNFTPSQFDMLNSRVELVTNQIEISALHRDPFLDGTLDKCLEKSIKPMAWSPLGSGRIFTDKEAEDVVRVRKVLTELSEKYDASFDQLLFAWLFKHPSQIIPILGTGKTERIQSAADALKINMDQEDWFRIWEAAEGNEVP
ncbi:aldo/keto reductase [Sediminitomix flava]|uniref:Putative oxidoreductase n=1 Tax=Sediminitomix flava TaxID=379075 RepID=A0A315Z760_SEDFL|nr:aldo/keto reductase [Sediminitomix flava]PWJ39245.1 putative oxidoreductase [Sediminitomix flava]